MRDLREGSRRARKQFGGRVTRDGDGIAQGSGLRGIGGGGFGEEKGQKSKLLVRL